jgi:dienelactone hydrolase
MRRFLIALCLLLAGCGTVSFPPADHDIQLKITGALRKPEGAGPFPAVVLMHGCGGVQTGNQWWADDFTTWGTSLSWSTALVPVD